MRKTGSTFPHDARRASRGPARSGESGVELLDPVDQRTFVPRLLPGLGQERHDLRMLLDGRSDRHLLLETLGVLA